MADLFKLFLFFVFIFFLVSNSKAVKPEIEEGIAAGNNLSAEPHYSLILPERAGSYY